MHPVDQPDDHGETCPKCGTSDIILAEFNARGCQKCNHWWEYGHDESEAIRTADGGVLLVVHEQSFFTLRDYLQSSLTRLATTDDIRKIKV